MGFITRVMDMVKQSIEIQLACDREIARINKLIHEERISGTEAENKKIEQKTIRDNNRVQTKQALAEIEVEFHNKVDSDNQLFGSMVNGDEKILDGSIKLDENQLSALVEKNRQNPYIVERVRKYCNEHHIFIDLPMSPLMRKNCFSDFIRSAQYAVYSPESMQAAMFLEGKAIPHGVDIGDMSIIPMQFANRNDNDIPALGAEGSQVKADGDKNGYNPFKGTYNLTLEDVHP